MSQLTAEDFSRMQREAKARVAEMQKRSQYYMERTLREQNQNRETPPPHEAKAEEPKDNGLPEQKADPFPEPSDPEKRKAVQNAENEELLLLLCLSILIGDEDRELFFLILIIALM